MKNKIFTFIILTLVLILTASLRIHTFYLPHNHGDQIFYLGLAMKLDKFGLKEYNLKGIDIERYGNFIAPVESADKEKGGLLRGLEKDNVFYYSKEPLSNMPPAFSFLIMLSHRIFSPDNPFMSVDRNLGPFAVFIRPPNFLKAQFYAVWLNFLFSLIFVLLVFYFGKLLFNENTGLWAAIMVAVSPVDILTSQRLWTDEIVSLLTILSVIFFWVALKNNRIFFFIISGVFGGIAALTKQSGIFIVGILAIFFIMFKGLSIKNLFDKRIILFILSAVAVSFFWYYKVTKIYGVPWYIPYQKEIEKAASWFIMLAKRPRFGQLYHFVYLMPLFVLFYIESAIMAIKKIFTPERILCLLWFSIYTAILMSIGAKEERYMLPVYPAIAVVSGLVIERMRFGLNGWYKMKYLGNIIIIALFTLVSIWSINIGLKTVFNNAAIFD